LRFIEPGTTVSEAVPRRVVAKGASYVFVYVLNNLQELSQQVGVDLIHF